MFYGTDTVDRARRVASYIASMLKGASPSELAVQQPIKFELVITAGR
jgi:hypothetical protein